MKLNKIGFSISLFVMLVSLTSCERTSQIYYEYDYVRDAYSAYSDLPLDERKYVSNDIEIPKIYLDRPVVEVRAYTFYGWKSLTNVKLPEGLKVIGAYSFSECLALNSIDIPSLVIVLCIHELYMAMIRICFPIRWFEFFRLLAIFYS